jgi:hypothetical protein
VTRSPNKAVRFSKVVERSGAPQVHTLWLRPDKDPELQRAQKAHRVMTVQSGAGGAKADVGTVGFKTDARGTAQFLIFPKSLKQFEGARIVGVKFDLVRQPQLASVDALKEMGMTKPRSVVGRRTSRAAGPHPSPATFSVEPTPATPPEPSEERESHVVPFEPATPAPETRPRNTAQTKTRLPVPRPPRGFARTTRESARAAKQRESTARGGSAREAALIRDVRSALKELQKGKSVAAYQRLERALSRASSR